MKKALLLISSIAIIYFNYGCNESNPVKSIDIHKLIISPDTLYFTEEKLEQAIYISINPSMETDWKLTYSPEWLSFDKTEGKIERDINVINITADYKNLVPGLINDKIEFISNDGGKANSIVYFAVGEHPKLQINLNGIDFPKEINERELILTNIGTGILSWGINNSNDTISLSAKTGSLMSGKSATIKVSVKKNYLLPGNYNFDLLLKTNSDTLSTLNIPLVVEVAENPILNIKETSLNFNYFIDTLKFYIKNSGNSVLDWNLDNSPIFLKVSPTSGQIKRNDSTEVIIIVNRNEISNGTSTSSIKITASNNQTKNIEIIIQNFKENKKYLDHNVIDAEFDIVNDKIITISQSPNALNIIDPSSGVSNKIDLPMIPNCVSVSTQGDYAVVGANGRVFYVDLISRKIINNYTVSCDSYDIVLANNNWAYIFPAEDQWVLIRCVNLITGKEVLNTVRVITEKTKAKLHPSGKYIYGANNGSSPDDIEKYDIQKDTAVYLTDSPYHGDYSFGSDLWISETGERIYTKRGNVFKASESNDDMNYAGKFEQAQNIEWASDSKLLNKVYLIPIIGDWWTNHRNASLIKEYDGTYFTFKRDISLEKYLIPNGKGEGEFVDAYGKFVFVLENGEYIYVLMGIDNILGPISNWAIHKIKL